MMSPDLIAQETECWVDLANRVVIEAQLSLLANSIEPQGRAEVLDSYFQELWAVGSKFAISVATSAKALSTHVARLTQEASRLQTAIAELPQKLEAKESALTAEMHTRLQIATSEYEEGGARLRQTQLELQAEVAELVKKRDEELSLLARFRTEADERRLKLQAQKIAAAEEIREAELELEGIKRKVYAERELLQHLEEEELVKRKKLEILADMSVNQQRLQQPLTQDDAADPTASNVSKQQAKLDFGVSTLQSVREQLRSIREVSSSPPRVATPLRDPNTQLGDGGTPNNASTSMRTVASYASPANPWKERLRQLQGDLMMLRQDLGAK